MEEVQRSGAKVARHWQMREGSDGDWTPRVEALEKENKQLKGQLGDLRKIVDKLQAELEGLKGGKATVPAAKTHEAEKGHKKEEADDEDVDLFGSDDEEDDEEKERVKQERLKAYEAKKSKKPGPIAKSSVILDVKPWDDETDLKELEKKVRGIQMDGLLWGASKFLPVAYGIQKLQIMCVVEDEKVSIDALNEEIEAFSDYVQSVDIAAFNKI